MSPSTKVVYPPKDILKPTFPESPDFEYIILWMLTNNEYCEWADFTQEISESTLSGHLKNLRKKELIEKPERNHYKITSMGKGRFRELNETKKTGGPSLHYPPKMIERTRNYDDIILWMVYNNDACRWSDFRDSENLYINSNSLSGALNSLKDDGFVINENKEYKITPEGKVEYFKILKKYDLDRQSILEEENKRINQIKERTMEFFSDYFIDDDEIKFRFLNNVLRLDYGKVKQFLKEGDFEKCLLYFSINHPDSYPDYISPEDFSYRYEIKTSTLNFFIDKVVEEDDFYPTKFFKLVVDEDRIYYIQRNETIEKILSAIVEKHIKKFSYLSSCCGSSTEGDSGTREEKDVLTLEKLIKEILQEVCSKLFHENLKPALRDFLPEYIQYLAYKVESETKLNTEESKLDGLIWRTIFDEFQSFETTNGRIDQESGEAEYAYNMETQAFLVLDVLNLTKYDILRSREFRERYNADNNEIFDEILELVGNLKLKEAREYFEREGSKLDDLLHSILEDLLASSINDLAYSISICDRLLEKYPDEPIPFVLKSLSHVLRGEFEEALDVIEDGSQKFTNSSIIIAQKAQLLQVINADEAVKLIDDTLKLKPDSNLLSRSKLLVYLHEKKFCKEHCERVLDFIDDLFKTKISDPEIVILKAIAYCLNKRDKDAEKLLLKEININPLVENPRVDTATYFTIASSYISRGMYDKALQTAELALAHYKNHPVSYLIKAMAQGYNLIYHFDPKELPVSEFMESMEKAIFLDQTKINLAKLYTFKSFILQGIKEFEDGLNTIDKALEIAPFYLPAYYQKIGLLMASKREIQAKELLDKMIEKFPSHEKSIRSQKSMVFYKMKDYEQGLAVLEDILKNYPEDTQAMNNASLFLAYLNRKDEAVEMAEKMIQLNPKDGNLYDSYGEILMVIGEQEKAIEYFEKALEIDNQGWYLFYSCYRMGKIYANLGNFEKAIEYLERSNVLTNKMLPAERDLYGVETNDLLVEVKKKLDESKLRNYR
jgi:tetratricopeptide (TPR) repeat protein